MTLWQDLIDIPEQRETFVHKLTEGLDHREEAVEKYVVTDSLADRFDQALTLIKDGMGVDRAGGTNSKGAFLHGSFGSGKSHFMTILNLLLEGYSGARNMRRLTDVVVEHDWMDEREFLMVPYHMLGSNSMESAVLGGYVEYIRKHHPEADLPGVYVADRVIDNAEQLRDTMGDATYFEQLNKGKSDEGDEIWGDMEKTWTQERYERALEASPTSELRTNLVGDVVKHLLSSVHDSARSEGEGGFVPFDQGLTIISRHAKKLGYDGLILFLDELVLWLSGHAANTEFLNTELEKVPQLVEAESSDRPVPIISFVARQKDLRDMIGDAMTGEELEHVGLGLEWWQGRFDTVKLEDRNLPVIASQRILRAQGTEATEQIRQSFDRVVENMEASKRDIMTTSDYELEDFRRIYPFSPALVRALIVLSNFLQRDRTALKLMQQLLIEHRDHLELGQIIPVGDLWDVIAEGEEPLDALLRKPFQTARRLYDQKMRPMLVGEHDFDPRDADPEDPTHQRKLKQFRDDARLLKTLLIAALVPNMRLFENLNVKRLLALNHGTVTTPIPGAEQSALGSKLQRWAGEINEIQMGDPPNPNVKVRLEGVNVDRLLEQVESEDSRSNRRRKLKELLFEWFDLEEGRNLRTTYTLDWRGASREAEVIYGNIRKMPVEKLESDGEHWRVLLDYPFDEDGRPPTEDRLRLREYKKRHTEGSETIGWMPSFLSADGQKKVGRLVKIEELLNRWDDFAPMLAQDKRQIAKEMLRSSKGAVKTQLKHALMTAYGLAHEEKELLDGAQDFNEHLYSLAPDHEPTLQHGLDFPDALDAIVREALGHKYPHAPDFPDEELTGRRAKSMFEIIREAIASPQGRTFVESHTMRKRLQHFAVPAQLGQLGDTHFVYDNGWRDTIERAVDADDDAIVVGDIFALLDPSDRRTGLPAPIRDLIVLSYAEAENMLVERSGRQLDAITPGSLRSDDVLVRRDMPSEEAWEQAKQIGRKIFDLSQPKLFNARNVEKFADDLAQTASQRRAAGLQLRERLVQVTTEHLGQTRQEVQQTDRYRNADVLRRMLLAMDTSDATERLEKLATLDLDPDSDRMAAVKASFKRASDNLEVLNTTNWKILGNLTDKGEARTPAEQGLWEAARALLSHAEHVKPLSELRGLEDRILDLMIDKPDPPPPDPPKPPNTTEVTETFELEAGEDPRAAIEWLEENVKEHAGAKLQISIRATKDESKETEDSRSETTAEEA